MPPPSPVPVRAVSRDPAAPGPPTRWPFRRIAFALSVTAFGAGIPTPLYPIYAARYHLTTAVLAGVFGAYTVGVLVTMLLVAPLSDLVGRKPVLYLGLGLTAASAVAWIFASGVLPLALARAISGLGVGATTSTATASMTGLEPHGDQHHVARVSVAANFGGVASGILLAGLLAQYTASPTVLVFLVLIGASAIGMAAVAATPETVPPRTPRPRVRVQRLFVPDAVRLPFWVAAGALAGCYSVYGLFAALAPTFVRTDLGVGNRAESAAVVAALFGAAALVQLALGQVRDRRALLVGLPMLLAGTAIDVVAIDLASLPGLLAGAVLLGTGVGFAYMGSVTLIDRTAPGAVRGEILSAFFVVGYLALAVPTIGIGLAADRVGLGAAAAAFSVGLGAFAAALFLATLRTPTPAGGEGRPRGSS